MGKRTRQNHPVKNGRQAAPPAEERHAGMLALAIVILALVMRMAALADMRKSIYADFLLWDERVYHEMAKKIATGAFHSSSVYEFSPLPAYLMALVYRLASPEIFYIRVMNAAFGVLTCGLIFLIGRRLWSPRVGLIGCLIACLYKPFIFYSVVPLKTALEFFLFSLTVYLFVATVARPGERAPSPARREGFGRQALGSGLVGAAAGLFINTRPQAMVILPVLTLFIPWHFYRTGYSARRVISVFGIFGAGLLLVLLPFTVRNLLVAGKFAITTSQAGFNLYLGNNLRNPDPYYRPVPFASASPFEQGIQFTIEASRRAGKRMSADDAQKYWIGEVVRQAQSQPLAFARKMGQKTLALFNRFEACDHYDIGFVSNFVKFFKLPFFSFWFVFPLGMAGLLMEKRGDGPSGTLKTVALLYALTLIVFFTNGRYRLLLFVILIPFAAAAAERIMDGLRKRNPAGLAVPLALVLLFGVLEFYPVRGAGDLTAYYNTHAIILESRGFLREAVLYRKDSSAMNGAFSVFSDLVLAHASLRRGNREEGMAYLNRISGDSFAAAGKYELLGDLMIHEGRKESAIEAYEKSLSVNYGQRTVRRKLILLYRQVNPSLAAREEETLRYVSSFYDLM